jgi:hypothetical protein
MPTFKHRSLAMYDTVAFLSGFNDSIKCKIDMLVINAHPQ